MTLDYTGLRCPQPSLKLSIKARSISPGTMVEVLADCPEFPGDMKKLCQRLGKTLISCVSTGGGSFRAQIQF